ncbi:hypothetical protein L210DRAFT_3656697 [Boletus edulis BED1]|uniref:Uncharacterized protein n=1 Tax=Boletus edulis BED1 TaxID=1328754 RepID=A0AAD4BB92_BOLED|nr:hypothetical protein L210DRAFT_3656697 [Boletus edulis BED1]
MSAGFVWRLHLTLAPLKVAYGPTRSSVIARLSTAGSGPDSVPGTFDFRSSGLKFASLAAIPENQDINLDDHVKNGI